MRKTVNPQLMKALNRGVSPSSSEPIVSHKSVCVFCCRAQQVLVMGMSGQKPTTLHLISPANAIDLA